VRALAALLVLLGCERAADLSGEIAVTGEPAFAPTRCVDAAREYGMAAGALYFDGGTRGLFVTPEGPDASVMLARGKGEQMIVMADRCTVYVVTGDHVALDCAAATGRLRADLHFTRCP
jgi:hypothetical protein